MLLMIWRWLKSVHQSWRLKPPHPAPGAGVAESVAVPPQFKFIGTVPTDPSQPITSGLSSSAEAALGQLLFFKTEPGHGWIGTPNYDPPEPFVARLERFFEWRGNRRGGVARVEQPEHPCDGMWVIFATRHVGIFDFEKLIEHYNVAILSEPPADPVDNGTFWVLTEKLPGVVMAGFTEIMAASGASAHASPLPPGEG